MATVNEAVRAAAAFFDSLEHRPQYDTVSVEEVELDEKGWWWYITLGFAVKSAVGAVLGVPAKEYRVFKVNNSNCEVASMKIREPNAVR